MGYRTFTANEEEVMEGFLKYRAVVKSKVSGYPFQIKKLLRNKFIVSFKGKYYITERGVSAIIQQIKLGHYWVVPLTVWRGVLKPISQDKIKRMCRVRGYVR